MLNESELILVIIGAENLLRELEKIHTEYGHTTQLLYALFYKNIFYKNIDAKICEILRIL